MIRKTLILLSSLLILLTATFSLNAQNNDSIANERTILILNSYSENSMWAETVISPVNYFVAQKDDVKVDIMHLNSTLITDSTTYEQVRQSVIKTFFDRHIDGVVFVGNLAFTFRDDVKNRWGDIPMLLLTRDLSLAPNNYYYSGFDKPSDFKSFPTVKELRPDYNFTTIFVPDCFKETIDLMVRLIPNMDEFVYFSDAVYFNRYLSREIQNYLLTDYPGIKFTWAQASYDNSDLLQYYLVKRRPNTGLLLSSWMYETTGPFGYPTLISGEMSLLSSSINPVFSLRSAYMNMGAVGGVYTDIHTVMDEINHALEAMISGNSMREIPFCINSDSKVPTLNYPLYQQYKKFNNLSADLPGNIAFVNKPQTFWEKYHWQTIIALILLALFFYLLARRNVIQRHEIELLSRHKQFVDTMPIPYTKAKVVYNDYMNAIVDVEYTMSNQAFEDIIRENSDPKQSYLLFSPEFISEKTSEMLEKETPINFLYHFKKSDKYYMFTLCLINTSRRKAKNVIDTIDMFAIDVTSRQKSEEDLKKLTKRLDMVIDVANLIPWEWHVVDDVMIFDAYSMFHRLKRSFDDGHLTKGESVINTSEFMKLIYPEDRQIVRDWREKLLLGEIKEFDMQYRLVIARQNKEKLEWVDVRGAVTETDENGRPLKVMGSMIVITDRKDQEVAILEAQRKTAQAEGLKSSFVSNISREVRVQLNAIVGFANLMHETDDAAKRKEFADIINENTDQLLDYIDKIVEESEDATAIPVHKIAAQTEKKEETPAPAPEVKKTAPAPAPVPEAKVKKNNKVTVLVAEDIEGNFLLLKHYIPKNYEVLHAWTGKEAVDMFKQHHPDIILMDIGMPVMDGYKATSEIRKFDTTVPIVAVTAYTANSDRELILQSGFDDYIAKPVMRDVLLETLKRYL